MDKITSLKKNEIKHLFKQGKRVASPVLWVIFLPNKTKKHRLAIIISRKTEKIAVKRNKLKRRLKEALIFLSREKKGHGFDIIIMPKTTRLDFSECVQALKKVLRFMH